MNEKKYINGFDFPWAQSAGTSAAAAGLILALGHDYVGFLYMSEVDLAITLPDYFSVLVRSKIGCRYIMVDAQCGEVLYIPGVMTPTEVRASFKT